MAKEKLQLFPPPRAAEKAPSWKHVPRSGNRLWNGKVLDRETHGLMGSNDNSGNN